MRAVNLDTYSLSLLTAKEDILNPRSSTNWALFTYDGVSNNLKLTDSGAGGVLELAGKFHIAKPQYGVCRVAAVEPEGPPRIAMISWVGQNVDEFRRTECASHVPAIKNFFKEAHVFISAERPEDVTEEVIGAELSKVRPPEDRLRRSSRSVDKEETVGTNYRKTNAAMEMRRINRDSFWARAEREEEARKDEEKTRAAEDRRRLERERVLKERREAEERERKMNEKLQKIEEQRRRQAQLEEEMHRKEKSKWAQEQREHEDEMRARLRRSESIEKAAEAAVLVSQRSMNPREFFRQLSSSSSQGPSSPGSPRSVKPPFRRYQRSLTDTAFIFGKSDASTPTSPRSPRELVSPFSRAPPSPLLRPSSPPSPQFRPIASPQWARGPVVSPPASPLRSAPPASSLPTLPSSGPCAPPPAQPTAPPASPGFLASVSPSTLPHSQAQALPPSPPATPPQPQPEFSPYPPDSLEPAAVPQPPSAPRPESPGQPTERYVATRVHAEQEQNAAVIATAVLVEEEEEEEEEKEEEEKPEPICSVAEPSPHLEEEEEGPGQDTDTISAPEPTALAEEGGEPNDDRQKSDQSDIAQVPAEPILVELSEEEEEPPNTDLEDLLQQITQETVALPSTNGIREREFEEIVELNGTEGSLSPSTDLSSPELAVCYNLHSGLEEDSGAENDEFSENGTEVSPERQMCVRALYDYQAEDESEISFEPGDIISAVETVDKAWWRGYSKDGQQGLFPANYVETI
ncbi:drebrin-like protein A isoform X2 [Osmerus mordax]|uniref:drebrin-like protein A isoform X2 n=1 Tax=Osmerus mordax TaxID=8014 RepID=UPI00350F1279